jgi:hypothetical protein
MPIIFEGLPPYEHLFAKSAKSEASLGDVVVTVSIGVEGLPIDAVPIVLVLEPDVARALAGQMKINADVAERRRTSGAQP